MRIDCSCGRTHNEKTLARIQKRCGGKSLSVGGLPPFAPRQPLPVQVVAVPGGQMMRLPAAPTFTARSGGTLRDLAAERAAAQRFERLGGTL